MNGGQEFGAVFTVGRRIKMDIEVRCMMKTMQFTNFEKVKTRNPSLWKTRVTCCVMRWPSGIGRQNTENRRRGAGTSRIIVRFTLKTHRQVRKKNNGQRGCEPGDANTQRNKRHRNHKTKVMRAQKNKKELGVSTRYLETDEQQVWYAWCCFLLGPT